MGAASATRRSRKQKMVQQEEDGRQKYRFFRLFGEIGCVGFLSTEDTVQYAKLLVSKSLAIFFSSAVESNKVWKSSQIESSRMRRLPQLLKVIDHRR